MSGIIVGPSQKVRIVGNWIHDNGSDIVNSIPQDHGIYWSGRNSGLIANNVIERNIGYGIHLYPSARATLVTGNTIVKNGLRAESQGASGIIIGGTESENNLIVNNILAWNGECGVRTLQPLGVETERSTTSPTGILAATSLVVTLASASSAGLIIAVPLHDFSASKQETIGHLVRVRRAMPRCRNMPLASTSPGVAASPAGYPI